MDELKVLKVAACDADANKGMASSFGVKSFPTIVLALDGRPIDTYNGGRTAPEIARWAMDAAGAARARLRGNARATTLQPQAALATDADVSWFYAYARRQAGVQAPGRRRRRRRQQQRRRRQGGRQGRCGDAQ
jgi:thioredoxin-like negative regulator of GroEL